MRALRPYRDTLTSRQCDRHAWARWVTNVKQELQEIRQFRDAGLSEPLIIDGFFETDPSTAPPGMQTRAVMMIAEKRN
jgi:hypothetical protein